MLKFTYVLLLGTAALSAQNVVTTGVVGIASGETAQVNVVNPGVLPPALGIICSATVNFVDDGGNVLKSGTFSILPGQSKALEIRSDTDLNIVVAGDRKQIRAVIASPSFAPAAPAGCKLAPTLEVLDTTTGRTLVVLSSVTPVSGVLLAPSARNP